MKTMKFLKDELMSKNIHPELWDKKDDDGKVASEVGYIRADHDGYAWWTTYWPVHDDLKSDNVKAEANMVFESFKKAFKDRHDMAVWCELFGGATSDPTEFNAFLELEHGYYWFRMITRRGDYNLYMHVYSRKAM